MSHSEEEYEVETITSARVAKKKRTLVWEFNVKWKGYPSEENTWEPQESFTAGSEHLLDAFWARAARGLNGRDRNDLTSFDVGDQFFPLGPPPRPKKLKKRNPTATPQPEASSSQQNTKRRRASPDIISVSDDEPLSKRLRTTAPTASAKKPSLADFMETSPATLPQKVGPPKASLSKPARKAELEVIPASDSEDESDDVQMDSTAVNVPVTEPATQSSTNVDASASSPGTAPQPIPDSPIIEQAAKDTTKKLPKHREREANPRVKLLDNFPAVSDHGAISAKSRAAANVNGSPSSKPKRSKPGPGRSSSGFKPSLLTWDKKAKVDAQHGKLVSVKGKYKKVDTPTPEPEDNSPNDLFDLPTGSELLELAGVGAKDTGLDDFEENVAPPPEPTHTAEPEPQVSEITNNTLEIAKDKLFPSSSLSAAEPSKSIWGRTSIFGPLGLGSTSHAVNDSTTESDICSFSLNVQPSVSLPVYLADISRQSAPTLDDSVKNNKAGKTPLGTFHSGEQALAIFNTFRTGGSSAKVMCSPNATQDQIDHFGAFKKRLENGDLFVAMSGADVLAFCSSENSVLFQRFNLPAELSTARDSIVVSLVKVEDRNLYLKLIMSK